MSTQRLTRVGDHGRAAPPVRLVHLGLGSFFRAHQAWYTERAPDADGWGIAAFGGRGNELARALDAQDGLYTLVERGTDGDRHEVIGSVARAHGGDDHDAWLDCFAAPDLAAVTITVTEAGYVRNAEGGLDMDDAGVRTDLAALRSSPRALVRTAPARLVAGLAERRAADAGPITVVPCDNVAGNGAIVSRVLHDLAGAVDPDLAEWIESTVAIASTMIDRITPRTENDDIRSVTAETGIDDRCPVVTEPFHEWVIEGSFPAGRPAWDDAGALLVDDVEPYEHRKLWLLNGAHSLLAYAGSTRGHTTVAEAVADDTCRAWVDAWWDEAAAHLSHPETELAEYRGALAERFANARIRHLLVQIAADGSQKIPIRTLPVLRAERVAGRLPTGTTRVVAAWLGHLRGSGAPVVDARAAAMASLVDGPVAAAAQRLLGWMDPALAEDREVVATVADQCAELTATRP